MFRTNRAFARTVLAVAATALIAAFAAVQAGADGMEMSKTHVAPKGMSVSIKVKADAMKGHNLFIRTKKFTWAPEHASGKHVRGEGHAHLYIDGVKITRIYGSAYYLGALAAGTHKVTVELNGNDHAPYVRAGKHIEATKTVTVP